MKDLNMCTICACATPAGIGAIAVIRVSGDDSITIVQKIFKSNKVEDISSLPGYSLVFGNVYKGKEIVDEVILSIFKSPISYTGEDSVEISCHGSNYIVREILSLLIDNGARFAEPGEFTKRAFLNRKMDLAQAEAIADLISSETEAAHKVAINQMRGGYSDKLAELRKKMLKIVSLMELELDFSEEDVVFADRKKLSKLVETATDHISEMVSSFKVGNAIKNGVPVAIVGATNVGKSTLLNALVGEERAIVSPIDGTTRDTIEDTVNLNGILFRFIDTAGIRSTMETIEMIGIERTYFKIKQASVVIMMLDAERSEDFKSSLVNLSKRLNNEDQTVIIIVNKCDVIIDRTKLEHIIDMLKHKPAELIDELSEVGETKRGVTTVRKAVNDAKLSPLAIIPMCAKKEVGLDMLREVLIESQNRLKVNSNAVLVTNFRHYSALKEAYSALLRVSVGIDENTPTDLLAQDMREAIYSIGTIVGEVTTDEVLGNIFKNFCIGK